VYYHCDHAKSVTAKLLSMHIPDLDPGMVMKDASIISICCIRIENENG
jgi:hypothetical protein